MAGISQPSQRRRTTREKDGNGNGLHQSPTLQEQVYIFFEDFLRKMIQASQDLEGTDKEMTDFLKMKTLLEKI